MSSLPQDRYTVEEYMGREARSSIRHEYFRGEVFSMAGASGAHSDIVLNLGSSLRGMLRGSDCKPTGPDRRLKVLSQGIFTYPDLMVICGKVDTVVDFGLDSVTNPTVLFEVLSASTEAYDRGEKFSAYQTIPSLREYILISQFEAVVETYVRQASGKWEYDRFHGFEAVCSLASLGLQLPLRDIYDDVTLVPRLRVRGDSDEP